MAMRRSDDVFAGDHTHWQLTTSSSIAAVIRMTDVLESHHIHRLV